VQVRVLPVTERAEAWAAQVAERLLAEDIRAEADARNEKIGAKIRTAQMEKIPYMLVVGDREVAAESVSVRHRSEGDQGAVPLAQFIENARRLNQTRAARS